MYTDESHSPDFLLLFPKLGPQVQWGTRRNLYPLLLSWLDTSSLLHAGDSCTSPSFYFHPYVNPVGVACHGPSSNTSDHALIGDGVNHHRWMYSPTESKMLSAQEVLLLRLWSLARFKAVFYILYNCLSMHCLLYQIVDDLVHRSPNHLQIPAFRQRVPERKSRSIPSSQISRIVHNAISTPYSISATITFSNHVELESSFCSAIGLCE